MFESGLTWRSILALIFGCVVLLPAIIFLYCVSGRWLAGTAWILLLLWNEVGRLFGSRLSKQELFIVYSFERFASTTALVGINLLLHGYMRRSPLSTRFQLREAIPTWFSPPFGSTSFMTRSLFHPDWILPVSVMLGLSFLVQVGGIALGYFFYYLYSRVEKLPFPIHVAAADGIVTLAQRTERRMGIVTIGSFIGMAYGALLYLLPLATVGAVKILPLPWLSLNQYMDVYLPGASLGIGTDLVLFASGFILPFNVVVWMLIGSLAIFTFGNHLLVKWNIWTTWSPGSSIALAWQQSFISFWLVPLIGVGISGALLPILRDPKRFITALRGVSALSSTEKMAGFINVKWLLLLYIASMGGIVGLIVFLIPDIPILYFICIVVGLNFLWSMISSHALALTGRGIQLPYLYQTLMLGSGYRGAGIWFMPAPVLTEQGSSWCGFFKLAELTETKLSDYVKAWVITVVLGTVFALIYTQALWMMAEMPSSAYPWLQTEWPIQTIFTMWWANIGITGQLTLDLRLLFGAMGVVTIIYAIAELMHLPFSLIGLIAGTTTLPPFTITMMAGALVGRYCLRRIFGRKRWEQYRTVAFAGLVIGEGVMITISAAIGMIQKSLWVIPY